MTHFVNASRVGLHHVNAILLMKCDTTFLKIALEELLAPSLKLVIKSHLQYAKGGRY